MEIGHVLFIDIVGYSKLLIEEQKERLGQLTKIVLGTAQVRDSSDEQLVRLPTGDGMALIFRHSAEEPARCALEIAEALRKHPEIPVRMGIHSGPVSEMTDVAGRTNIAGAGINMAQRVMDCGDAGHILLSQRVAEDLAQYRQWAPRLHDLGECEVKHGVRLHVVNLYTEEVGNPAVPERIRLANRPARTRPARLAVQIVAAILVACAALWLFLEWPSRTSATRTRPSDAASNPGGSTAIPPPKNPSDEKGNAFLAIIRKITGKLTTEKSATAADRFFTTAPQRAQTRKQLDDHIDASNKGLFKSCETRFEPVIAYVAGKFDA